MYGLPPVTRPNLVQVVAIIKIIKRQVFLFRFETLELKVNSNVTFQVSKHLPLAWSKESQSERTKLLSVLEELSEKTKPNDL